MKSTYNKKERNTYIFVDTMSAFCNAPTVALKMVHYKTGTKVAELQDSDTTVLKILRVN